MIAIPIIVFAIAWIVYDLRRRKHHVEVDGIGSGGRDVVLALGRFEGRQLLRHPAFLTGIGFVALAALILARSGGDATDLSANTNAFGFFAFPLAGMSIIAVSLGVLRARRDGAEELLESMPASEDARAGSHLLTAAWAIAVAAVCMGVLVTASYLGGSYGWPNLPELLVGPVLVGCAVAVGVTAARLVPSAIIGFVAVIAMGVFQGMTDHFTGPQTTRTSWFAPFVQTPEFIPDGIWPRRPWSHLVYLIGLGAFAAVLGFLVRRVGKRKIVALAVSLGVIAAGGIVQSRPFSLSAVERAAAYIDHPALTCRTKGTVEYCAYPDRKRLIDRWAPAVENVLRVAPSSVRARRLRVVQRVGPFGIYALPGRVLARLSTGTPRRAPETWRPDGAIHPNLTWCSGGFACSLALATQTGAWAVGLPLDPKAETRPDPYGSPEIDAYDASGQARAIVALWLGAQSSPGVRALFIRRMSRRADPKDDATSSFTLRCSGIDEPGTRFGVQDASLVEQLLGTPDGVVARVFEAHWGRLTDPKTRSDAVVKLFGLRPANAALLQASAFEC